MSNTDSGCHCDPTATSKSETRILITVLILNFSMFLIEFSAGIVSHSTALLADSLDMFADAFIYALSLFALNQHEKWRIYAAMASGVIQLTLGIGIAISAIYKIFFYTLPNSDLMGIYGIIALVVNLISFMLLMRFKEGNINIRASWICSRNDMIANVGVLIAAALVAYFQSAIPDILIGLAIALVVIVSAVKIIKESTLKKHKY
ncbi:Cobalt-zinc-cadmium resistance protein CzcD [hydrothermal vent metagenome]|uniref:Cobalt-zinc-cadmium resistance protein CzcD n=1 Tax=hydrothermal vent metagenome TaxID=652676 RepID=A0A3B1AQ51_9ZZZZ